MNIFNKISNFAGLSRPVVGLQVTPHSAHAVVLNKQGEKVEIVGCHAQDFHAEGFLDEMDFAEHLPEWLGQLGLQEADVILGIPQDVTTVQILEFPPNSENSLDSMVSLQTSQLAELSDEAFKYDYSVMPHPPEHPLPVLVGVCLESFIQDRLEHYGRPGVQLADLGMDSVGLVNACAALKPEIISEEQPQLILDMGIESTTVVILGAGRVHYAGWLNVGLSHYQNALAEKHDVDRDKVRSNPDLYRVTRRESREDDPLARVNRLFMNELQAAFDQWQDQSGEEEATDRQKLSRSYLTGAGAALPGFMSFLEHAAGTNVEVIRLTLPTVDTEPAAFTVAYGLALQGTRTGLLNVSLAPREARWVAARRHRTGIISIATVLLVLLLSTALFWNFVRLKEKEQILGKQARQLKQCEDIITGIENTLAELSVVEKVQIPLIEHSNRARRFAAALGKLSDVRGPADWFIYLGDSESFESGKAATDQGRQSSHRSHGAESPPRETVERGGLFMPREKPGTTSETPERRPGRTVTEIAPLKAMITAGYTRLRPEEPLEPVIKMVDQLNQTDLFNSVDWLQASYLEGREDIFAPWQEMLIKTRSRRSGGQRRYKDFALQMPFSSTDIIKSAPDTAE